LGVMIGDAVAEQETDAVASAEVLARLDVAFVLEDISVAPALDVATVAEAVPETSPAAPSVAPDAVPAGPPPEVPATAPPANRAPRPAPARDGGGTVMVPVERLDELVRMVGEAAAAHRRVGRVVMEQCGVEPATLAEFTELSRVLNGLQERAMRTRMVPVSTITDQLHRAVRDAARALDRDVRWEVRGETTELDRGVLHHMSDALLHIVRNAIDHGVDSPDQRAARGKPPQATVRLHAMQLGSEVTIAVSDDGGGIDLERVRENAARLGIDTSEMSESETLQLIFRSGFSTAKFVSDISGRGIGLDAVHANVEAIRGRMEVRSTRGQGSEFRIVVPITLAVLRCLLVEAAGQQFALPLHRVALAQSEATAVALHAEGRRMMSVDGRPVPVSDLAELLDLEPSRNGRGTLVVVNGPAGRHAFLVDAIVGEHDVAVKGLSSLVPRLDIIAGASVETDGTILLVLDPPGLIERARRENGRSSEGAGAPIGLRRRSGRLLVVDDALTVRELQRSILERAGFDVRVAGDGIEALEQLDIEAADLVLTDVEMPRMDGFTLTETIRRRTGLENVAVLILTSLASDADRQRGLDAGADGYIVKSAFDEQSLLAAVDRLVGVPA
ncbi:MAG TPA: response regulator, partial [Ilumatobacteraceae bacterium]